MMEEPINGQLKEEVAIPGVPMFPDTTVIHPQRPGIASKSMQLAQSMNCGLMEPAFYTRLG